MSDSSVPTISNPEDQPSPAPAAAEPTTEDALKAITGIRDFVSKQTANIIGGLNQTAVSIETLHQMLHSLAQVMTKRVNELRVHHGMPPLTDDEVFKELYAQLVTNVEAMVAEEEKAASEPEPNPSATTSATPEAAQAEPSPATNPS